MTLLRKMSEHCNFEKKVNEHICDHLVVGVKDEKIQERLQGERMLTLEKAIEIAVSMGIGQEVLQVNARDFNKRD